MEKTELIIAGGTVFAALIGAVHKYWSRSVDHEEQDADREVKILVGHIEQLQKLWEYSRTETEDLRKKVEQLSLENVELRHKVADLEAKLKS